MTAVVDAASASDRLDFYLACVRDHEPREQPVTPLDELRIFDNSSKRVPSDIRFVASTKNLGPAVYDEYLDFRMATFALEKITPSSVAEFAGYPGALSDPTLSERVEQLSRLLSRQRAAESQALIRRLAQLPREIVVEEWYKPGESFDRWADAVIEQSRIAETTRWETEFGGDYASLLQRLTGAAGGAELRDVADFVHGRIGTALERLRAHLRGEGGLDAESVAALSELRPVVLPGEDSRPEAAESTLLRVARAMAPVLAAKHPSDLLNAFVVAVARATGCAFCDFLRYDHEQGIVSPVVNSQSDADLDKLLRDGAYLRAQGITGSAVLLPEAIARRWVGTNLLADDPRQSMPQARSYSEQFGSINDYWVFPVFRDGDLYGAFRVVNRSPARWMAGTPWTEATLWELREVATWCESALLPHLEEARLARSGGETAHSGAVQHLKAACDLDWIDEDFLVRLVTHMTSVAHRKVEKNSVGCCIGVFDAPEEVLTHEQPYYAAGDVQFGDGETNDLDSAAIYYPRVNPSSGMFVFDVEGGGQGVVNIRGASSAEAAGPERVTSQHPRGVVLLLERGQDCIRVVMRGRIAADYYLSDATGVWTLRSYSTLRDLVISAAPEQLQRDDVSHVFDQAVELSYRRIGAMLIVGDGIPSDTRFERATYLRNVNLRSLSRSEFADMARTDGAVHIETTCRVACMGAIVRVNTTDADENDGGEGGSRHSSALAFSRCAPGHVVFVISENRPMSVFIGGTHVLSRK